MKKLNLLFDERAFFSKCDIFETSDKLKDYCSASLQSWIDDYDNMGKDEWIVSITKDLNKCRNFMKYLLDINNVSERDQNNILKNFNASHARKATEDYSIGISFECDDKLAKTLVEDINVLGKLVDKLPKPLTEEKIKKIKEQYKFSKDIDKMKTIVR